MGLPKICQTIAVHLSIANLTFTGTIEMAYAKRNTIVVNNSESRPNRRYALKK